MTLPSTLTMYRPDRATATWHVLHFDGTTSPEPLHDDTRRTSWLIGAKGGTDGRPAQNVQKVLTDVTEQEAHQWAQAHCPAGYTLGEHPSPPV